jgi:PAS domain S-box-containing protein
MTTPLRVLIVEDSPDDAELMAMRLTEEGFRPEWQRAETEPDYRVALETPPDLILADWSLPQFSGLRALQLMRERGLDIPFVIVSGSIGEEAAIDAMHQGAYDYVLKDHPARLGQAVRHALEDKRLRDEKRQAEQAQRESEARYRSLFEHMPVGLYRTTPDGRILHANPALVEMLGYPDLKSLMAANTADVHLDPAERVQERALLEQEGGVHHFEMRMRRYDGAVIWVRDTVRAIRGSDGRALYYEGSLEDITERKQAQEALQKSEGRLKEAQALGRIGNWEFDVDNQTITWSDEVYRLYERDPALGPPTVEEEAAYYAPDQAQILREYARRAIEEGKEFAYDLQAKLPSRTLAHFSATMRPIKDESGRVVRLFGTVQDITERKRAEEALSESEEKYRNVVERANDGITIIQDSIIQYANPRVAEIWGGGVEEVIGTRFGDYIDPDELPKVAERYRRRMAGESITPIYETVARCSNGEKVYVEVNAGAIKYQGNPAELVIVRDITQRKQAEQALQRRAAQMALLNDVGSRIAAAGELQSVLERAAHLVWESFGYHHVALFTLDSEQGELVMQARAGGFAHLFPPQHRIKLGTGMVGWVGARGETILANDVDAEPRYANFLPDVLPTRAELSVPIRVGEEIVGVLDVQSEQPNAFDGNDVVVIETLADQIAVATENARLVQELRQHAEELEQRVQERTAQLQSQYARLDAVLSSAADGIIVTSSQGEILLANLVAQGWLGAGVRKGVQLSGLTNAPPPLPAEEVERLQEAVRDLAARAAERPEAVLELTGLDLQLSAAPISETGEDSAAAVVAVHDVSQLKALDRLKSQFVSNVSHELRTPITTIKLYAGLLRRSKPEKWPEYLDALTQEADRQAKLVEDVLQVSRIDAARLEIRPQPANLNELAQAAVAGHQTLAQSKDVVLEYRLAEPGPTALVDSERMMQVLNNLVENGIRYTPQGKVEVATGQAETEKRTWATISVSDTGMGIPEEELPHIFERFFRGEKPRQTGLPGSGLGLAIAKEIVELHGGRITVESQVGTGSAFTVWLPPVEEQKAD